MTAWEKLCRKDQKVLNSHEWPHDTDKKPIKFTDNFCLCCFAHDFDRPHRYKNQWSGPWWILTIIIGFTSSVDEMIMFNLHLLIHTYAPRTDIPYQRRFGCWSTQVNIDVINWFNRWLLRTESKIKYLITKNGRK